MKTNLKSTSPLLCAVLLTVAVAFTAFGATRKETPTPKGAKLVADAKPALSKTLSDGRHVLPTKLGDGEKLVAVVKKGQPTKFMVEDKQGKQISSTQHTNPPVAGSRAVSCWICYTSNGRTKCVEITCPGQPTI